MGPCIPDRIGTLEVLVFVKKRKPEKPEKNPRRKDENKQQTQPIYEAGSGIDSNPGHIGGKQTLSPLRHPYFPNFLPVKGWPRNSSVVNHAKTM